MEQLERAVLTVREARHWLGISRSLMYQAIHRGEVPSIRIGRRILIPRGALERLLDQGLPVSGDAKGPGRDKA